MTTAVVPSGDAHIYTRALATPAHAPYTLDFQATLNFGRPPLPRTTLRLLFALPSWFVPGIADSGLDEAGNSENSAAKEISTRV